MATLIENHIISSLQREVEDGRYDNYNIGSELRYIGALPTSNNNNFEEEMIIGEDKIVTSKIIRNNNIYYKYQELKFKKENDKNYYILEITDRLEDTRLVKFKVEPDEYNVNSLYLIYTDNIPTLEHDDTSENPIRELKLYYCQEGKGSGGSDLKTLISTRKVCQKAPVTIDGVKTTTATETIIPN